MPLVATLVSAIGGADVKNRKKSDESVAKWVKVGPGGGLQVSLSELVQSETGRADLRRTEELRRHMQRKRAG